MPVQLSDQVLHDRINLHRLLRRLEKTVASPEWEAETRQPERAVWMKTKGMLQSLQYAKTLLENVEQYADEGSPSSSGHHEELRTTIHLLERQLEDTEKRVTPPPTRPRPILPTLPLPAPFARETVPSAPEPSQSADGRSLLAEPAGPPQDATQDLLLSPDDTLELHPQYPTSAAVLPTIAPPTLLPPTLPRPASPTKPTASTVTASPVPASLANSHSLHEELSEQLARMATQLKYNALHFSSALDTDKAVVEAAQEKIERNYDVMTKERVRLRDQRSKSWGTTWLLVLSVVVAGVGFVLTFFVIRLT